MNRLAIPMLLLLAACGGGSENGPSDSSKKDSAATVAVVPDSVRAEQIEKSLPDSAKLRRVSRTFGVPDQPVEGRIVVYYAGNDVAWVVVSQSDGSHCGQTNKYAWMNGKLAYYFSDEGCWFFDQDSPVDEKTGSSGTVDEVNTYTHIIADDTIIFTTHVHEKFYSTPGKQGEKTTRTIPGPGYEDLVPANLSLTGKKWAEFANSTGSYGDFFGEI